MKMEKKNYHMFFMPNCSFQNERKKKDQTKKIANLEIKRWMFSLLFVIIIIIIIIIILLLLLLLTKIYRTNI